MLMGTNYGDGAREEPPRKVVKTYIYEGYLVDVYNGENSDIYLVNKVEYSNLPPDRNVREIISNCAKFDSPNDDGMADISTSKRYRIIVEELE